MIIGQDKIPVLGQILTELESLDESSRLDTQNQDISAQIRCNRHNPITATYYLLIKKYERDTAQNLVFGKFTRDKRLQEAQTVKTANFTQSAGNLDVGSMRNTLTNGLIVSKNKPISSSMAAVQENYTDNVAA